MKLEFSLPVNKPIGSQRFCEFIIKWLRADICRQTNMQKLQTRVDLLLSASWIDWIRKPTKLDAMSVCKTIVQCFEYKNHQSHYIIYLNPNKLFPGTRTPVERISRFLDKGNDIVKGTYFISSILLHYRKSIYRYWRAFCLRSQFKNNK